MSQLLLTLIILVLSNLLSISWFRKVISVLKSILIIFLKFSWCLSH